MAHASPFARVPVEIDRKAEATGLGLLTTWAPQQLILNNPVSTSPVESCYVLYDFVGHRLVCISLRYQQHCRDSDCRCSNVRRLLLLLPASNRHASSPGLRGHSAQSKLSTPFIVPLPSTLHMNSSRCAPKMRSRCTAQAIRTRVPSRQSVMKRPQYLRKPLVRTGR